MTPMCSVNSPHLQQNKKATQSGGFFVLFGGVEPKARKRPGRPISAEGGLKGANRRFATGRQLPPSPKNKNRRKAVFVFHDLVFNLIH